MGRRDTNAVRRQPKNQPRDLRLRETWYLSKDLEMEVCESCV